VGEVICDIVQRCLNYSADQFGRVAARNCSNFLLTKVRGCIDVIPFLGAPLVPDLLRSLGQSLITERKRSILCELLNLWSVTISESIDDASLELFSFDGRQHSVSGDETKQEIVDGREE